VNWSTKPALRWAVVAGLLFALILIPFALWGGALEQWLGTGHWTGMNPALAALAGAVLLAADILLPIPSSLIGTILGAILGGWIGTLVGAAGLTAGCVLGYAIGWTIGNSAARQFLGAHETARATAWLERYGIAALIVCRAVPVLAEASVIMAGALRMAPLRAFATTTLSNIGISSVYATIGASASNIGTFLLAFALAVAVPAVVLSGAKMIERIW
jgi:uncharacterized membrane protein YdjX (TVP38/TMEM64 family)